MLCWELPHHLSDALAGAIVDGTVQAAHRFDRYKAAPEDDEPPGVDSLIVSDHDDRSDAIARATAIAYAVTEARDLQDTPANDMTPTALAEFAQGLAAGRRSRSWVATRSSPPGWARSPPSPRAATPSRS